MKRSHILLATAAFASTVAGCDSLKEAFTAHVDTVARAGGQELTTERLAKLIGNSTVPVQKGVVSFVADYWVTTQLLANAGAHGDALEDDKTKNWWIADKKAIDEAMWASVNSSRIQKLYDEDKKKFAQPDTTGLEQKYAQSEALAAQHILILQPEGGNGMSAQKQEELRKSAESIRAKVTSANFAEMAKKYSEDPGSKNAGGTYAMFAPGAMVPEFEQAVRALKPGEISGVVKTTHGYHIIRRHELSEVRQQFVDHLMQSNEGTQQKAYVDKIRNDWKGVVKPEALAKIREVAKAPAEFHNDRAVIATSRVGDFTAARLASWIEVIPPQMQIGQRLTSAPDSTVIGIVRSILDQEILAAEAKKRGIEPDTSEIAQIHTFFAQMVKGPMAQLRVDPKSLGDSAKSTGEKEKLAAARADEGLEQLFATGGQSMVQVSPQLAASLRARYASRINQAGIDRTVERATQIRAAKDSTAGRDVPMPSGAVPVVPPPGKGPPPSGR